MPTKIDRQPKKIPEVVGYKVCYSAGVVVVEEYGRSSIEMCR